MNPFVPKGMPRFVIIDYRAEDKIINYLKNLNISVIKTIRCNELQEPVDGHPDMVMHPVDYETFVVAPNVYDYYKDILNGTGVKLIKGEKVLKRDYPEDIAYNVARVGSYAIHNFKHTDDVLKYYLDKLNTEFINVGQGYSKCSVAAVGDNAAVTSDKSIHEKLVSHSIDCLYVNPEFVLLEGYNHGFIGGSAGLINNEIFLSTGKILDTSALNTIKSFVRKAGYTYAEASGEQIADLGSLIPVM